MTCQLTAQQLKTWLLRVYLKRRQRFSTVGSLPQCALRTYAQKSASFSGALLRIWRARLRICTQRNSQKSAPSLQVLCVFATEPYICAKETFIRKRAQENDNPADFWDFWEHHICLTFENITFVSCWVQGANRRREIGKRALYFRKRALHIHKRALENNQLTFGKITFAWLLRRSYLSDHHVCQLSSTRSQPSTWYWHKCSAYSKKSPIYSQKSPTYSPHNPTNLAQSPREWPMS